MATSFSGGKNRVPGENHLPCAGNWYNFSVAASSQLHPFCHLQSRACIYFQNRIGGVMVRVSSDVVDLGFEPHSDQTKVYFLLR